MGFLSDLFDGITGRSATRASDRVVEGQQQGIEELRRQFDLNRKDTADQRELQGAAGRRLSALLGLGGEDVTAELRDLPGHKFQLGEGKRALNTGGAARGNLFSGQAGIELQRLGQGLADQNYGNEINRLMATNAGGQAAQQTAAQGSQVAGQIANAQGQQGAARASGILGRSNQLNSLIGGGIRLASGGFGG